MGGETLQKDVQVLLRRLEDAVSQFVQSDPHSDEYSCVLTRTPGRDDEAALEFGLHVDTINDEPRRFSTALLYLNDLGPESGGQTIFPIAADAPMGVKAAGSTLLNEGYECTATAPEVGD